MPSANGLEETVEILDSTDNPTGVFEVIAPGEDYSTTRDVGDDIAVYWWAQIASDVALGRRVLPLFIRARLDDAALFAALDAREQYHFEAILNENAREEAIAASERMQERI